MTILIDRDQGIPSPALVPAAGDLARDHGGADLTIGLINNMPDPALKATERQFMKLLQAAAGQRRIRFHCFSLPSVKRSPEAKWHVESEYSELSELRRHTFDGLIVTGAEPIAPALDQEPYWQDLTELIDWAKINTRSTIWSCLAAHAAVLHLDRIERRRLPAKCHGVFHCEAVTSDPLTCAAPAPLKVPHSRLNEIAESDLAQAGYQVLTRSAEAGVDIFVRQYASRFVFFQGHPEYDALSLQREYLRDVGRYLARERDDYPRLPVSYFDAATEEKLVRFEKQARHQRHPALTNELPALNLRADIAAGSAAAALFRNWLQYLGSEADASVLAR
ncbi:homoserine O-succinyltransferase [Bradyrhizobium diazoefficiens]|nr:homoserine O-succinyltransferase [Bradyrhizobium diazoefficiens]MBR0968024.1 homoserine O-succinyltransferase [Bradyrhizobium diazoefficiens]MBR0981421.1 homoserine O-succinyltransferase [Bradyrhizobium diazoefficiens]MBR1010875.1 homoserine O-succinyltransferase [Bradyrhizobium diazoefficiens]MBR1015803.1 homoserine O-succinyltransferase [Bradyrhizobium diazoefficiens]MBR1054634.1 homoserine O-succinyltransferase [Bradyrhizobium diazoefficiens]